MTTLFVTGGAGFIGSNFVHRAIAAGYRVVNLDALTYAGNLANLDGLDSNGEHVFVHGSINDDRLVAELLTEHHPAAVINFAAESHVDRSIDEPQAFVATNVNGAFALLEMSQKHYDRLSEPDRAGFRFLHVSTDEVYGSLDAGLSAEDHSYAPNSPYAASKAAADHLVRAYNRTYGLPTLVTNCGNNYGPRQFPEKLIPLMILNAIDGAPLPIYGDGGNTRDWLYVDDHCAGLMRVLEAGQPGETYNIGGAGARSGERTNIAVVEAICDVLDRLRPRSGNGTYRDLMSFVDDRPGHDRRYAIDAGKIERELGWQPEVPFADGLHRTIEWYLDNEDWWQAVRSGSYRGERLGLGRSAGGVP